MGEHVLPASSAALCVPLQSGDRGAASCPCGSDAARTDKVQHSRFPQHPWGGGHLQGLRPPVLKLPRRRAADQVLPIFPLASSRSEGFD